MLSPLKSANTHYIVYCTTKSCYTIRNTTSLTSRRRAARTQLSHQDVPRHAFPMSFESCLGMDLTGFNAAGRKHSLHGAEGHEELPKGGGQSCDALRAAQQQTQKHAADALLMLRPLLWCVCDWTQKTLALPQPDQIKADAYETPGHSRC